MIRQFSISKNKRIETGLYKLYCIACTMVMPLETYTVNNTAYKHSNMRSPIMLLMDLGLTCSS